VVIVKRDHTIEIAKAPYTIDSKEPDFDVERARGGRGDAYLRHLEERRGA